MNKMLDSHAQLRGNVRGPLGAKINADRLKLREIYRRVKDVEDRLPDGPAASADLTDVSLAALFDAYAITAVNLLGEIWFCGNRDTDGEDEPEESKTRTLRRKINAYIKSISWMIPVLKWRNKVAAHPAAVDPRPASESPADRDVSLMPTAVGAENGRYVVPVLTPIWRERSVDDNTPTLARWSLTQNWEQLLGRFPWLVEGEQGLGKHRAIGPRGSVGLWRGPEQGDVFRSNDQWPVAGSTSRNGTSVRDVGRNVGRQASTNENNP